MISNRISKAYQAQFSVMLRQLGARKPDKGIALLFGMAFREQMRNHLPLALALARIHAGLRHRINWFRSRQSQGNQGITDDGTTVHFVCDVGLGGLARWLRAAGYDAIWEPNLTDAGAIELAQRLSAVLLTTDSLMMERRVLRDGVVPSLWIPPTLKMREQLALLMRELRLPLRDSRCMTCGGRLKQKEKESLRELIPPKTYRWVDDYFQCERCGKLFWHGTHWSRIRQSLEEIS